MDKLFFYFGIPFLIRQIKLHNEMWGRKKSKTQPNSIRHNPWDYNLEERIRQFPGIPASRSLMASDVAATEQRLSGYAADRLIEAHKQRRKTFGRLQK